MPSPFLVPAHSPTPILPLLHPSPHQTLLTNYPPSHVLAALEHLATEREAEIRSQCSQDRLQDTKIARCVVEYFHGQAGQVAVGAGRGPRPGTVIIDRTETQEPNPGVDIGYPQESKQGDGAPPSPVSPHPQVPGPRSISFQPGPAVRDASHPGDPRHPSRLLPLSYPKALSIPSPLGMMPTLTLSPCPRRAGKL